VVLTPGDANRAGVVFSFRTRKTRGRVGRKNRRLDPSRGPQTDIWADQNGPVWGIPILSRWLDHVLMEYGGRDSNPQSRIGGRLKVGCVYQFRHRRK
jgi:hypothetical protein